MNIPYFDFNTFKKYEREIGLAAENKRKLQSSYSIGERHIKHKKLSQIPLN